MQRSWDLVYAGKLIVGRGRPPRFRKGMEVPMNMMDN